MIVTPEQIAAAKATYEGAMTAVQAAKAIVDNLKATSADTVISYERAKAAYDALKPNQVVAKARLARAKADVTIARAEYQAVDPKEVAADNASRKGTPNKELLTHVQAFLSTKPKGATNQEIFDGLLSAGTEMAGDNARANLNSYLSRWASAGSLISKGPGSWGAVPTVPPTFLTPEALVQQAPPFVPAVPFAVTAPVEPAPSFLAPVQVVMASDEILGEDFPGVEPLTEAGLTSN